MYWVKIATYCSFMCGIILIVIQEVSAEPLKSLVVQGIKDDQRFPVVLLRKAITNGKTYQLEYLDDKRGSVTSEAKLHNDLNNGAVDIIWTLTSAKHETSFKAVYIPIYRGLLGMRIGIVPQAHKNLLEKVKTVSDLRQFKAGQGALWADTQILKDNDIPVVEELKYQNLFPMLEGGRFDYFPRGIPEPWSEIEREAKYNLVVDPHILIRYTAPFYYFVKKNNHVLANHLTEELNKMVDSGEFEGLFFADAEIKSGLAYADLETRTIIELDNATLTPQTPLDRTELWFDPDLEKKNITLD